MEDSDIMIGSVVVVVVVEVVLEELVSGALRICALSSLVGLILRLNKKRNPLDLGAFQKHR